MPSGLSALRGSAPLRPSWPGLPAPTALCPPEIGQDSRARSGHHPDQGRVTHGQPGGPGTAPGDEPRATPSPAGATRGVRDPPQSAADVPRQRADVSAGQTRAAVTAGDSQRPSPALAATAAPGAPGGRRSDREGDGRSGPAAAVSSQRETAPLRVTMPKAKERGLPASRLLIRFYFAKTLEHSRAQRELLPLKLPLMKFWGIRAKRNLSFMPCAEPQTGSFKPV